MFCLDKPKVSIIILNYNGAKLLGELLVECIESVLLTDYPSFEVLFVDNASSDNSLGIVRSRFGSDKRLKIIQNSKNLGFAEGNNIGLKLAQGKYIALLNNDTRVDSDWLKNLVKIIAQPDVGAVQSKLLLMSNPNLVDCAGGFIDYYGYAFEKGHGKEASRYTQVSECFYGKGASVLLKREVLKKTGLLDKDIFIYYDETDLCWRIRLAGYKILFVPTSIVYHAVNLTASNTHKQKTRFFCKRNQLMILVKNFELGNLIKFVTALISYEIREIIMCCLKCKTPIYFDFFRALSWNLFNFKKTWKKRVVVQKLVRKVSDEEIKQFLLEPYPPFPLYPALRKLGTTTFDP
jgi:GT2 family glycosyltransferase